MFAMRPSGRDEVPPLFLNGVDNVLGSSATFSWLKYPGDQLLRLFNQPVIANHWLTPSQSRMRLSDGSIPDSI